MAEKGLMVVLSDDSLVTVTPIVTDDEGNITNKGVPAEISLSELAEYLSTSGPSPEIAVGDINLVDGASVVGKTGSGAGVATEVPLSVGTTANTLAYRGAGGTLAIGTPTGNTHATTKLYVDTADNRTPNNTVRGGVLQQAAQANSAATDVAGLVTDFNALLAKLRTAGVLAT